MPLAPRQPASKFTTKMGLTRSLSLGIPERVQLASGLSINYVNIISESGFFFTTEDNKFLIQEALPEPKLLMTEDNKLIITENNLNIT